MRERTQIRRAPVSLATRAAALGALSLCLMACRPESRAEVDLATLLARHTEARGGEEAIEAIESIAVELEITEPEFTVTGKYVATRDGHMRIDVFVGDERVFTEALGPDGGWQMHANGVPLDLSPEGEAALRRGIDFNLYGLHELAGRGFELELIGPAEREGERFWEVLQVAPDGSSKTLFFNPETYVVSREMTNRALHPDLDPTEIRQETRHTDHSTSGGVLFANRGETVDLDTGEVVQTSVVTARSVNGPVDSARFHRPPPP